MNDEFYCWHFESEFTGSDMGIDCDFGLTEFCDNPDFRLSGNCFQCETYLEACKEQSQKVNKNE